MRTWNLAVVCLAILSLQSHAAMPIVNLKSANDAAPKSQSISMQMLIEDPNLIYNLGLSDDEIRELKIQIATEAESRRGNESSSENSENQNLIHKVGFFDDLFAPLQPRPSYNNSYNNQYNGPNYNPEQVEEEPMDCPNGPPKEIKVPTDLDIVFPAESMNDPNDWKSKNFDVVVVINKAVYGQDMKVWRRLKPEDKTLTLIKDGRASGWKVSTGRESKEISNCDRKKLGMPLIDHGPNTSYFSQTPTVYAIPQSLDIDHVSGDYEGSAMDHTIMFLEGRGIATHRAPHKSENLLGSRASGACVRMDGGQARELFWMVRATGGPITNGELAQDDFSHCAKIPKEQFEKKQNCIAVARERRNTLNFRNELKLAQVSGFQTYPEWKDVPRLTEDGRCLFPGADEKSVVAGDCNKEGFLTTKGYRTLYVVENRFVAKPVPVKKKTAPAPAVSTGKTKVKRASATNGSLGGLY